MYVSMYVCIYVCVCVYVYMCVCIYVCMCVCVREREKQEYHILYYFFYCSYLFGNYSNIIFTRKFLVSHNFVFICFFMFF